MEKYKSRSGNLSMLFVLLLSLTIIGLVVLAGYIVGLTM